MSGTVLETNETTEYFRAIERIFLSLRGAPLTLSEIEYEVARSWRAQGIPLEVIQKALESVFSKLKGKKKRGITTLRYCAPAVEHAWEEIASLTAAGRTAAVEPIDVGARLAALARALPAELPEREGWSAQVAAVAGSAEEVERRLAELDAAILDRMESGMDEAAKRAADESLRASLAKLAARLPAKELEDARAQLLRQHLRRVYGLPLLSLFAPEADPGAPR